MKLSRFEETVGLAITIILCLAFVVMSTLLLIQ